MCGCILLYRYCIFVYDRPVGGLAVCNEYNGSHHRRYRYVTFVLRYDINIIIEL